jgi:hypothetical protein
MDTMRKSEFNLDEAAISNASRESMEEARRVLETNQPLLRSSGVVGSWVGARASKAYIMLALKRGSSEKLKRAIPDSIDGVSIYFIEGTPSLQ